MGEYWSEIMQSTKNGSMSEDTTKKFITPYRVIKLTQHLHPKGTHVYAVFTFQWLKYH